MNTTSDLSRSDLLNRAWSALAAEDWAEATRLAELTPAPGEQLGEALHVQALASWGRGDAVQALALLAQATAVNPSSAALLSDLGVLRYFSEDWAGAAQAFRTCLKLQPDDDTALRGHAESLLQTGDYIGAEAASRRWIAVAPTNAVAHRTLAESLAYRNELERAAEAAAHSLTLDAGCERTLLLMAAIRQGQRRFESCLKYSETAARLHPDSGEAWARFALALWDAGDLENATAARARAIELGVKDRNLCSDLNWLALHDPAQTASSLLTTHRNAVQQWCGPSRVQRPHSNHRDPQKRLRVGYVSGEFSSNAAYCFLAPWLKSHDPAQVETFYYMSRPREDAHTAQYRRMADHWRDVARLSDDQLETRIREDGIDILVDLSGHFEHNRLPVFARRPAPVQATFPNYPGSTGLDEIDYVFTDEWTTPAGCESEYAETPYRLASGYLVYMMPPEVARITALPALTNGYITFGFFQRPGKLHTAVWDAMASILAQVPDSRLLVHFASAELDDSGAQCRRFTAPLEARGIASSRVFFRGMRATPEHLAVVAEADIALDTFPYNGQTTTCDCLWMGVPVVSVRGASHVARVTPALLDRARLGHLAAPSVTQYVRTACNLARNPEALTELRSGLRERMRRGSLTDGRRLAREIEDGYRQMWRRWCERDSIARRSGAQG